MKEIVMTISSKGQVTIPVEVRHFLQVKEGQKIALVLEPETKSVRLKLPSYPNVSSLVGAAGSLSQKMDWKEVLETARTDGLTKKHGRRK